jgi:chemotaxis protein methyltransferase CheR
MAGVSERSDTSSGSHREFTMTYADFVHIREIAYELTGITLSDHKQNMIYGRLARRLRALGLNSFDRYCELLEENSPEVHEFINAITTNLTAFFREKHHFDFLRSTAFPSILQKNSATKRLRIWSAGCSTGEEPYSIAMTLSATAGFNNWNAKILATDLDTNVVEKGRNGIYQEDRCTGIPEEFNRYLKRNASTGEIKIREDVQDKIAFKQLNLLHQWPMKGPFDIIFCRNVVIYFDQETQKKLFARYHKMLADGGYLFIGHSENLNRAPQRLDPH